MFALRARNECVGWPPPGIKTYGSVAVVSPFEGERTAVHTRVYRRRVEREPDRGPPVKGRRTRVEGRGARGEAMTHYSGV